jgi:tetratricopeptide (TPR) repeat protein
VICLIVIALGYGTYQRNKAWQSVETLWLDALTKAPNSARALDTLAIRLAWEPKANSWRVDKALSLFERSLSLPKNRNWLHANVLGNMASIYAKKGDEGKAFYFYRRALAVAPDHLKIQFDLTRHLVKSGIYSDALHEVHELLAKDPHNPRYLNLAGFIFLRLESPQEALPYFQQALKSNPYDAGLMLNAGAALSQMNHPRNADWFFKRAIQMAPGEIWGYFFLIENLVKLNDQQAISNQVDRIAQKFSVRAILAGLNEPSWMRPPISRSLIRMTLLEYLNLDGHQPRTDSLSAVAPK